MHSPAHSASSFPSQPKHQNLKPTKSELYYAQPSSIQSKPRSKLSRSTTGMDTPPSRNCYHRLVAETPPTNFDSSKSKRPSNLPLSTNALSTRTPSPDISSSNYPSIPWIATKSAFAASLSKPLQHQREPKFLLPCAQPSSKRA